MPSLSYSIRIDNGFLLWGLLFNCGINGLLELSIWSLKFICGRITFFPASNLMWPDDVESETLVPLSVLSVLDLPIFLFQLPDMRAKPSWDTSTNRGFLSYNMNVTFHEHCRYLLVLMSFSFYLIRYMYGFIPLWFLPLHLSSLIYALIADH